MTLPPPLQLVPIDLRFPSDVKVRMVYTYIRVCETMIIGARLLNALVKKANVKACVI